MNVEVKIFFSHQKIGSSSRSYLDIVILDSAGERKRVPFFNGNIL